MKRIVVMIRPEQRVKLEKLAGQAHVSAAEIHRRAIDAYETDAAADSDELERLAKAVLQSNREAMQSLQGARKAIRETLIYFKQKGKNNGDQQ